MLNPLILGPVPSKGRLMLWLLRVAHDRLAPLLQDPAGSVERLGDLLVWNGRHGRHVLAYLEQTAESQRRIEAVVQGVQSAQVTSHGALGGLYSLSVLGLGLTTLGGGLMILRMNALQSRLAALQRRMKDIEANLQAKDKARLLAGIAALEKYEQGHKEDDRRSAKESSLLATKLYGELLERECQDGAPRRLPVMDYYGRCYLVALATQLRCHILAEDELEIALTQLDREGPRFNRAARVAFQQVMGNSPERFLDPGLGPHGVTLDLLAEIYQQARGIGAVDDQDCSTASELFEQLRDRIFGAHRGSGWVFAPRGRGAARMLSSLRYLMTSLEEAGRIGSLRIRVEEAIRGQFSLREVERWLREMSSGTMSSRFDAVDPSQVFAFTMS